MQFVIESKSIIETMRRQSRRMESRTEWSVFRKRKEYQDRIEAQQQITRVRETIAKQSLINPEEERCHKQYARRIERFEAYRNSINEKPVVQKIFHYVKDKLNGMELAIQEQNIYYS